MQVIVRECSMQRAVILNSWYPGARGGKAVAEALFGEYSPSGKLPITFYQGTENLPEFTDYHMAGRTQCHLVRADFAKNQKWDWTIMMDL